MTLRLFCFDHVKPVTERALTYFHLVLQNCGSAGLCSGCILGFHMFICLIGNKGNKSKDVICGFM